MKRVFSLFILFVMIGSAQASVDNTTSVKDSLLRVLNHQSKDERLNTLYSLACLDQMSPSCAYYLGRLLEEATELENKEYQCLAMYGHVIYYFNHQDENNTTVWMQKLSPIAL